MDHLTISHSYFGNLFDERFVKEAKQKLKNVDFDTLVGVGFSGILATSQLSYVLKKKALYLRKGTEKTHSSSLAEGEIGRKWIFVDDFIATGETFYFVYDRVQTLLVSHRYESNFVGMYLYQGNWGADNIGFHSIEESYVKEYLKKYEPKESV